MSFMNIKSYMIYMSVVSTTYRNERKQQVRRPYQPGRSRTSEIGTLPSSADADPGGSPNLTREGMTCGSSLRSIDAFEADQLAEDNFGNCRVTPRLMGSRLFVCTREALMLI